MGTEKCIFCAIVRGETEASIPYQDEATIAFMDLRQFHPGHVLVVPRRHVENIFGVDDKTGASLMAAVTRVARAVHEAFEPHGMNIWQSNGKAAGQEVFHIHFHVLPRWNNDRLLQFYPARPGRPPRSELDEHAEAIRSRIG